MEMEHEFKWYVKGLPEGLPLISEFWVTQYMISTNPYVRLAVCQKDLVSGRVRAPKLTVKGAGTHSREEIQTDIADEKFIREIIRITPCPVTKHTRWYRLPSGRIFEVSNVNPDRTDPPHPLTNGYYAELEFETEQEMMDYVVELKDYPMIDVTEEPLFKMNNYAAVVREFAKPELRNRPDAVAKPGIYEEWYRAFMDKAHRVFG